MALMIQARDAAKLAEAMDKEKHRELEAGGPGLARERGGESERFGPRASGGRPMSMPYNL